MHGCLILVGRATNDWIRGWIQFAQHISNIDTDMIKRNMPILLHFGYNLGVLDENSWSQFRYFVRISLQFSR